VAVSDFDVIELNEAFASQGLAVLRELGVADDAPQVNPNGGAIALGHPLGMSGARLVLTALHQLEKSGGRKGLATMCVGLAKGWRWPSSGFDLYRPLRGQALTGKHLWERACLKTGCDTRPIASQIAERVCYQVCLDLPRTLQE
jgi:hypothetical protein